MPGNYQIVDEGRQIAIQSSSSVAPSISSFLTVLHRLAGDSIWGSRRVVESKGRLSHQHFEPGSGWVKRQTFTSTLWKWGWSFWGFQPFEIGSLATHLQWFLTMLLWWCTWTSREEVFSWCCARANPANASWSGIFWGNRISWQTSWAIGIWPSPWSDLCFPRSYTVSRGYGRPTSDLFTAKRNHKLPLYISPILDPMA